MNDLMVRPAMELDRVAARLDEGYSIPYAWYTDPAVFQIEMNQIWRRSWQVAGPLEKVAVPGDHFTCEVAGVPILVVRGKDDELRAFLNVCRHRGFEVASGQGNRRTLQCKYHAWTYNLDGTLKGAPGCQLDATFDMAKMSLLPVSVASIGGVVFVNPDAHAAPLTEVHPTLATWVSDLDIDLGRYSHVKTLSYEVSGNWKLVYENASECYHCATIHPSSLTSIYDPHGEREICDQQLVVAHASRFDGEGQGIRAVMGFPGFVVQQDDYVALSAQILPDEFGRTRFVADVYANLDVEAAELEEHYDLWDRTFQEDMDAVAIVNRGISAGLAESGRLIAAKEQRTVHIQRILLEAFRGAVNALEDRA